ncbi:MAG: 30S ribosomal protein S1 [Desulfobacterales bacterium]|nr:30S ribosomal protein S1 [Desulfobacterales bacterium]
MEESFAELFKKDARQQQHLKPGQKVSATVTSIGKEYVFIDVGTKGDGSLELKELLDEEGNPTIKEGDKLGVYFLGSVRRELQFTTRLTGGSAAQQHLQEAFLSSIPVEGTVVKEIKGGFEVKVAGTRAFCPFSQIDLRRAKPAEEYLDQRFLFKITEYDPERRNLLVSRRAILEEEREEQKKALAATLTEGAEVRGTITSIRDFGAFADIGGIDGLIPISEIAWGRVDNINDLLSIGQEVTLAVLKLDWDRDRITLSLRAAQPDPWEQVDLAKGSCLQGTVVRLVDFGAFVTLKPGIDGLLHISKLGKGRRLNHPREVLEQGQMVEVCIEEIDCDRKRISLALPDQPSGTGDKTGPATDHRHYLGDEAETGRQLGTLGDLLRAGMKERNKKREGG